MDVEVIDRICWEQLPQLKNLPWTTIAICQIQKTGLWST
jgi:hypothetical protein